MEYKRRKNGDVEIMDCFYLHIHTYGELTVCIMWVHAHHAQHFPAYCVTE